MTAIDARPAIRVSGLRKSYGKQVVLDGIDLEIAEGTVFALLGPNGAGKTTTVHILSTLTAADGGEAQVAGHDVRTRARRGPRGDRPDRPVLGGRRAVHRRGEPPADGRPAPSRQGRGSPPRRRAARAVRPRRRREEARLDLFGRDEATAGPRDDPRGRSADHLPRRADGGPRSPEPAGPVGHHPRPRRPRASRSS